jgi:hypothetical protein
MPKNFTVTYFTSLHFTSKWRTPESETNDNILSVVFTALLLQVIVIWDITKR